MCTNNHYYSMTVFKTEHILLYVTYSVRLTLSTCDTYLFHHLTCSFQIERIYLYVSLPRQLVIYFSNGWYGALISAFPTNVLHLPSELSYTCAHLFIPNISSSDLLYLSYYTQCILSNPTYLFHNLTCSMQIRFIYHYASLLISSILIQSIRSSVSWITRD
jgi:hypothetical protein